MNNVTMMLVKEGHCVDKLENNMTPNKKFNNLAGWSKTTDTKSGQVLLWMPSVLIPEFLSSIHGAEF